MASGFAVPVPAMSGAEPCTGSNRPGPEPSPERGARQHAQRAGEHRRLVAEDVAEHVLGQDHVELRGSRHQLHRGVVDQHVLERDVARPRPCGRRPCATAATSPGRSPCPRSSPSGARGRTPRARSARSRPRCRRRCRGRCRRRGRGRRSRCPPVSSRTTSRSVPSIRSRLSGLASSSAGLGRTGRRLANRPRPLRRPSRPCSGRGAAGSVVSHLGPPTAASSTASAPRQASSTSSVSAVPCASIDAPPISRSSNSKSPERCRARARPRP